MSPPPAQAGKRGSSALAAAPPAAAKASDAAPADAPPPKTLPSSPSPPPPLSECGSADGDGPTWGPLPRRSHKKARGGGGAGGGAAAGAAADADADGTATVVVVAGRRLAPPNPNPATSPPIATTTAPRASSATSTAKAASQQHQQHQHLITREQNEALLAARHGRLAALQGERAAAAARAARSAQVLALVLERQRQAARLARPSQRVAALELAPFRIPAPRAWEWGVDGAADDDSEQGATTGDGWARIKPPSACAVWRYVDPSLAPYLTTPSARAAARRAREEADADPARVFARTRACAAAACRAWRAAALAAADAAAVVWTPEGPPAARAAARRHSGSGGSSSAAPPRRPSPPCCGRPVGDPLEDLKSFEPGVLRALRVAGGPPARGDELKRLAAAAGEAASAAVALAAQPGPASAPAVPSAAAAAGAAAAAAAAAALPGASGIEPALRSTLALRQVVWAVGFTSAAAAGAAAFSAAAALAAAAAERGAGKQAAATATATATATPTADDADEADRIARTLGSLRVLSIENTCGLVAAARGISCNNGSDGENKAYARKVARAAAAEAAARHAGGGGDGPAPPHPLSRLRPARLPPPRLVLASLASLELGEYSARWRPRDRSSEKRSGRSGAGSSTGDGDGDGDGAPFFFFSRANLPSLRSLSVAIHPCSNAPLELVAPHWPEDAYEAWRQAQLVGGSPGAARRRGPRLLPPPPYPSSSLSSAPPPPLSSSSPFHPSASASAGLSIPDLALQLTRLKVTSAERVAPASSDTWPRGEPLLVSLRSLRALAGTLEELWADCAPSVAGVEEPEDDFPPLELTSSEEWESGDGEGGAGLSDDEDDDGEERAAAAPAAAASPAAAAAAAASPAAAAGALSSGAPAAATAATAAFPRPAGPSDLAKQQQQQQQQMQQRNRHDPGHRRPPSYRRPRDPLTDPPAPPPADPANAHLRPSTAATTAGSRLPDPSRPRYTGFYWEELLTHAQNHAFPAPAYMAPLERLVPGLGALTRLKALRLDEEADWGPAVAVCADARKRVLPDGTVLSAERLRRRLWQRGAAMALLPSAATLQRLEISCGQMLGQTAVALPRAVARLTALTSLEVWADRFDAATRCLSPLKELTNLQRLVVEAAKVHKGCSPVWPGDLRTLARLRYLRISHVEPDLAPVIARGLPSLKTLVVRETLDQDPMDAVGTIRLSAHVLAACVVRSEKAGLEVWAADRPGKGPTAEEAARDAVDGGGSAGGNGGLSGGLSGSSGLGGGGFGAAAARHLHLPPEGEPPGDRDDPTGATAAQNPKLRRLPAACLRRRLAACPGAREALAAMQGYYDAAHAMGPRAAAAAAAAEHDEDAAGDADGSSAFEDDDDGGEGDGDGEGGGVAAAAGGGRSGWVSILMHDGGGEQEEEDDDDDYEDDGDGGYDDDDDDDEEGNGGGGVTGDGDGADEQ